jgi:hypothetical protein
MAIVNQPVILSTNHVNKAIKDPNFYTLLPEFLPLKRKMEAMHLARLPGCGSCTKNRANTSISSSFVSILANLSDDGYERLKKYLGVNRLIVRSINKVTRKTETRTV